MRVNWPLPPGALFFTLKVSTHCWVMKSIYQENITEYVTLDLDKYCFMKLLCLLFYLPICMCVLGHYVKCIFFFLWVTGIKSSRLPS